MVGDDTVLLSATFHVFGDVWFGGVNELPDQVAAAVQFGDRVESILVQPLLDARPVHLSTDGGLSVANGTPCEPSRSPMAIPFLVTRTANGS